MYHRSCHHHHHQSYHWRFSNGRRVGLHWRKYAGSIWIVSSFHFSDFDNVFLDDECDDNDDDGDDGDLPQVSNVDEAGKAEGEAVIIYPDHLTVLAVWCENGKMVQTSIITKYYSNIMVLYPFKCKCK